MDCVNGGLFSSCLTGNTVDKPRRGQKAKKANTGLQHPDRRSPKWANAIDFDPATPERQKQIDIQSDLLRGLFLMIDQNDSGSLQLEELRAVMGNADTFMSVQSYDAQYDHNFGSGLGFCAVSIQTAIPQREPDL